MSVYVDSVRHRLGRMIMCHMWADTLEELLAMAERIGVSHRWLQQPPYASWVHFDVSRGKAKLALRAGAFLTDRFGPSEHCARIDISSGDPQRIAAGLSRLAQIDRARARRSDTGMTP